MNRENKKSSLPAGLDFYKEHPKTCDPDDFWGQVKRTVNGKPVTQDQIDMIVQAVCNSLNLSKEDLLLDLCCGNGALTTYFFEKCSGGLGVDFSEYLISIAISNFKKSSKEDFLLKDIIEFVQNYHHPKIFTKAVCYGSIQYLHKQSAFKLFRNIRNRFCNIQKLFIGNVPNKQFMKDFFKDNYIEGIEDSPASSIGVWWSKEEFAQLAKSTGWIPKFLNMQEKFYSSHYRYDVILTPDMRQRDV